MPGARRQDVVHHEGVGLAASRSAKDSLWILAEHQVGAQSVVLVEVVEEGFAAGALGGDDGFSAQVVDRFDPALPARGGVRRQRPVGIVEATCLRRLACWSSSRIRGRFRPK